MQAAVTGRPEDSMPEFKVWRLALDKYELMMIWVL